MLPIFLSLRSSTLSTTASHGGSWAGDCDDWPCIPAVPSSVERMYRPAGAHRLAVSGTRAHRGDAAPPCWTTATVVELRGRGARVRGARARLLRLCGSAALLRCVARLGTDSLHGGKQSVSTAALCQGRRRGCCGACTRGAWDWTGAPAAVASASPGLRLPGGGKQSVSTAALCLGRCARDGAGAGAGPTRALLRRGCAAAGAGTRSVRALWARHGHRRQQHSPRAATGRRTGQRQDRLPG